MNISKKNEEILVWGTGINAVDFSCKCRAQNLKIKAYIDNNKREEQIEFNDVPVYTAKEAQNLLDKYYIVVATSDEIYWIIKKQLDKDGYREFEDYCWHKLFRKKIAVIYGNCHIAPIKEGLENSELFANEYGFYPLHLIQTIYSLGGMDLNSCVFEYCSLFIHQDIRNSNKFGYEYSSESLLKRVNPKACVIAIPNLYGLPKWMFPQIDKLLPEKRIRGQAYFSFRDKFIEAMYEKGCSISYICEQIKMGDLITPVELENEYNKFIEKINRRQRKWDIKICDWIDQAKTSSQLFYDINHPTNEVISYIVYQVLNILEIEDNPSLDFLPRLDTYEVPIYGVVMKTFKMHWENSYTLKKYSRYTLTHHQIGLHQYVTQYIAWNYWKG